MNVSSDTAARAPAEERARAAVAAPRRRRRRRFSATPYLYVLPALVFYALFTFLPLLHTVWLSFYDWDGITVGTWVGLDNYRELWNDQQVRDAFRHSFVLVFFYALPTVVGLTVSAFLARSVTRGMGSYRMLLFLHRPSPPSSARSRGCGCTSRTGRSRRSWGRSGSAPCRRRLARRPRPALTALGLVGTWTDRALHGPVHGRRAAIPLALRRGARRRRRPVREFFAVTLPACGRSSPSP